MKKNKTAIVLTILICVYVFFLNTETTTKVKILISAMILSLFSLLSMPVYSLIIGVGFVTLIFNTYKKFSINIDEITNFYNKISKSITGNI